MYDIMVYRPGCAARRTVFENQLLLYQHLQERADLRFTIAVDEESFESDDRFQWHRLPKSDWKSFRGRRWFLNKSWKMRNASRLLQNTSRIITLDPTVYPQAHLIFEVARTRNIPIWIDSTITLLSEKLFGYWDRFSKTKVIENLEQCEIILVPTPKVIERYASLGILTPKIAEKFRILGHPVDTQVAHQNLREWTPAESRFVCVSRLTVEKGITYIVESFLELLKQFPKCTLCFIGDGDMRQYIKQRAGEHFEKSISIHPPIAHRDLMNFLKNFDCYVSHPLEMPYWEEYFGVATLEAMATGLQAITTPTGGIPFVFRSCRNVKFVPARNIFALTDAMTQLCKSPASELTQAATYNLDFIEKHYSLNTISQKWMSYHHSCVAKL